MDSYAVAQGTALSVPATILDVDGNPVTTYTGTETLSGTVQTGSATPSLCAPTVAWATPSAGDYTIALTAAQTALLPPGIYLLRRFLKAGAADPVQIGESALVIEAAAGPAVVLPTYTSGARIRELAPWTDLCFDPARHLTGFLREQATAREIFDNIILRQYRGNTVGMFGSASFAVLTWAHGGRRRSSLPSQMLIQYLANNQLLITPQVDRINAWLAVAEIGRQQIGINNAYAALGAAAGEIASSEISACTAQIDLNGDGIGEIPIPLGATNPIFT